MLTNNELVSFCLSKVGVPYVMGTSGKVLTQAMYSDLVKRNPSGWFTAARLPKVKSWIGKATTDCHGLIEWFLAVQEGKWSYDTSADGAFSTATEKGTISTIPELTGVCVRYPGHVGIYIGSGKVVEARGYSYGVCVTELKDRGWTHWYKHPKISYEEKTGIEVERVIKKGMTTAQIQQVLDKAGYIEFEKATFDITTPLLLKSNTELNLNGATLRQAGKINHILLTDSNADTTGYDGVGNIEIYGGTLEGMGKYATQLNLLTLCHASNIRIHDMKFQDVVEFHDIEINSSCNVLIENSKFAGYNSSLDADDYRECIQIDSALQSALVVVPAGSAWYDGTPSRNVIIKNCSFKKSDSRPAPSQCIGNHCQFVGEHHQNIIISGNTMTGGNQTSPSGSCILLVGMDGVQVVGNTIEQYGRGIRIHAYEKSYDTKGNKVAAVAGNGVCRNVQIVGNKISNPSGTYKSSGVFISNSAPSSHENILIESNTIEKGGSMKYAVDCAATDGVYVRDNVTKAVVKISKSCTGATGGEVCK